MENNTSFWDKGFGLFIRWAVYIPIGLLACAFVQAIAFVVLTWLFKNGKEFLVFGILAGGIAIIPLLCYLLVLAVMFVSMICPKPRYGMIVFASVNGVLSLLNVIINWNTMHWLIMTITVVGVVVVGFMALSTAEEAEKEERERLYSVMRGTGK